MTFLSLHLMVKHRQAEVADAMARGVREGVSSTSRAPKWPMHGRSWADYHGTIDPNIGRLGGLSKLTGFRLELGPLGVWAGSDRRSAIGHFHA